MLVYCCTWKPEENYARLGSWLLPFIIALDSPSGNNGWYSSTHYTRNNSYQFGIPPTNTSELVANFPKWNSLPRDVRIWDTPSTVSVVCSSFRWTCGKHIPWLIHKLFGHAPDALLLLLFVENCIIKIFQSASVPSCRDTQGDLARFNQFFSSHNFQLSNYGNLGE